MRGKLFIISIVLFIFLLLRIASGNDSDQKFLDDSNYIVLLLKPSDSEINLSSILTEIELQFKVEGIKIISSKESVMGTVTTESISDSFNILKEEIIAIENEINDFRKSVIKSNEEYAYSIININDQITELKSEVEKIEMLTTMKDRKMSQLTKDQMELRNMVSEQKEEISELKKGKNDVYQYINKSISSSNKFIAMLFIILILLVFALTFGAIKDRYFTQTYKWL